MSDQRRESKQSVGFDICCVKHFNTPVCGLSFIYIYSYFILRLHTFSNM